jgi:hypothetical protein
MPKDWKSIASITDSMIMEILDRYEDEQKRKKEEQIASTNKAWRDFLAGKLRLTKQ